MPSIYHFIVVVWLNINNCPKDTVYNATFKEYNNINRGMINVINIALMIHTYPNCCEYSWLILHNLNFMMDSFSFF
jgi:hypothetical protein